MYKSRSHWYKSSRNVSLKKFLLSQNVQNLKLSLIMRILNVCHHYPGATILPFLNFTLLQPGALNLYKLFIILMLIVRSQSILDISFQ